MSLVTVYGIEYKTIKETIAAVQSAPGSMYTKGDVISLLSRIKPEQSEPVLPAIHIEELENILGTVFNSYDSGDIVDYDEIEFSINYDRRIEIENVNVDLEDLKQDVIAAVRGYFEKTA